MSGSVWVERLAGRNLLKGTENHPLFSTGWWSDALHRHDLLHGLELTLFDWRARQAADFANALSPQLCLVVAQDSTVQSLRLRYPLNEPYGLP